MSRTHSLFFFPQPAVQPRRMQITNLAFHVTVFRSKRSLSTAWKRCVPWATHKSCSLVLPWSPASRCCQQGQRSVSRPVHTLASPSHWLLSDVWRTKAMVVWPLIFFFLGSSCFRPQNDYKVVSSNLSIQQTPNQSCSSLLDRILSHS